MGKNCLCPILRLPKVRWSVRIKNRTVEPPTSTQKTDHRPSPKSSSARNPTSFESAGRWGRTVCAVELFFSDHIKQTWSYDRDGAWLRRGEFPRKYVEKVFSGGESCFKRGVVFYQEVPLCYYRLLDVTKCTERPRERMGDCVFGGNALLLRVPSTSPCPNPPRPRSTLAS